MFKIYLLLFQFIFCFARFLYNIIIYERLKRVILILYNFKPYPFAMNIVPILFLYLCKNFLKW
jgi:hypothetical protein